MINNYLLEGICNPRLLPGNIMVFKKNSFCLPMTGKISAFFRNKR